MDKPSLLRRSCIFVLRHMPRKIRANLAKSAVDPITYIGLIVFIAGTIVSIFKDQPTTPVWVFGTLLIAYLIMLGDTARKYDI